MYLLLNGVKLGKILLILLKIVMEAVISKLKSVEGEFCDMLDERLSRKTALSYASSSFAY
jgi:hypothetical protein